MILEHRLNLGVEWNILHRIPYQVADHPDSARVGQLDHRDNIGATGFERRMHGIQIRIQVYKRPRPETFCQSKSGDWHLWQINSGAN